MSQAIPSGAAWPLEHHRGPASAGHGRELPDPVRRVIWWFDLTGPAVALGSTQGADVVHVEQANAAGVEVVRRRSGGGAVWLAPGAVTWVDVVVPAGDPVWLDDVGRSNAWLGRAWAAALAELGVDGVAVHEGPMVRSANSDLVCFAGLAAGEVTLGGRKAVGISQRRNRDGARFQCAVLHHWDPRPLVDLLRLSEEDRLRLMAEVAEAGAGVGSIEPSSLVAALVGHLNTLA